MAVRTDAQSKSCSNVLTTYTRMTTISNITILLALNYSFIFRRVGKIAKSEY